MDSSLSQIPQINDSKKAFDFNDLLSNVDEILLRKISEIQKRANDMKKDVNSCHQNEQNPSCRLLMLAEEIERVGVVQVVVLEEWYCRCS